MNAEGGDMTPLTRLTRLYDGYVDAFRDEGGALPQMMQLKRVHTGFVVKNAALIADGEGFDALERETALAHDIVKEKGWLGEAGVRRPDAVLAAVLYHNRRDLPAGLERVTQVASDTVRDADKLDIFRVLEDQVANTDWRSDSRAFWNLAISAPPSPVVVKCIEERRPVDYQSIQSLADFVLIQVGWMISGLAFPTSRRLCAERRHLEYRREFLHQLTDSPSVDRVCDVADGILHLYDNGGL